MNKLLILLVFLVGLTSCKEEKKCVDQCQMWQDLTQLITSTYLTNLYETSDPRAFDKNDRLVESIQEICFLDCHDLVERLLSIKKPVEDKKKIPSWEDGI